MRTMQEIANAGTITENEIRTICRRLNAGTMKVNELEPIWNAGGVDVTPEQSAKGFKWLMNLWKPQPAKSAKITHTAIVNRIYWRITTAVNSLMFTIWVAMVGTHIHRVTIAVFNTMYLAVKSK